MKVYFHALSGPESSCINSALSAVFVVYILKYKICYQSHQLGSFPGKARIYVYTYSTQDERGGDIVHTQYLIPIIVHLHPQ